LFHSIRKIISCNQLFAQKQNQPHTQDLKLVISRFRLPIFSILIIFKYKIYLWEKIWLNKIIQIYYGWFHGTCDTFTLTFTKSFEIFRACAIIIFKTFLPLDKSYNMFCWRAVVQIPSALRNDSLKYVLLYNPRSFALLYAIEILMIDSDSSSSGLSEWISFKNFWIHLRMVGLWKPFL